MSADESGSISDRRRQAEAGQGLVEYALIVALVALVVATIMVAMGPQIGEVFSGVYGSVRGDGGARGDGNAWTPSSVH